jgi:hypothetical protein
MASRNSRKAAALAGRVGTRGVVTSRTSGVSTDRVVETVRALRDRQCWTHNPKSKQSYLLLNSDML